MPSHAVTSALWSDSGFESDAINSTPPAPWILATALNPNPNGYTVATPETFADLNLAAGGLAATTVVGGATGSQPDPDLGAGESLRYPKFGLRSAVVNWSPSVIGKNNNVNYLTQQMTVAPGDYGTDGQFHARFVLAPVLQNPGHGVNQQPYFFVQLKNITTGNVVYQDFNFSNQTGVPWITAVGVAGGDAVYTDWQLVDIVPGSSNVTVGDTVELLVLAAGCSLGGHWGRVYIDGFGSSIPGLYVTATGPQSANAGANITYTLSYANNGAATATGSEIDLVTPPNTTFTSVSIAGCTTPAVGATGTIKCPIGTLVPGAGGSLQVTVGINAGAVGTITNGNYWIQATGVSPLIGPKVDTTITSGVKYADVGVTISDGQAAVGWGQAVTYTIVVSNAGPNAASVTVKDTMPAQLTAVTWTCVASAGATCANASGSNNIAGQVDAIPSGGNVTYTVSAKIIAGSGSSSVTNGASAAVGGPIVDPNSANNSAAVTNQIGTLDTLTVTKSGTGSGTITSSPSAISCGATCSGAFLDGSQVVLSATATSGSAFAGWGGACAAAGTSPTCTITMSPSLAVTANFTPACASNANCSGATPVCDPTSVCVRCVTTPDCPAGATCNASEQCVEAAPVVVTPADGSNTVNTKPPIKGTATPGAVVTVSIAGLGVIGSATANGGGNWTVTPTTALALGTYMVNAIATVGAGVLAVVSPVSNTNTFHVVQCVNNGNCGSPTPVCNTTSHTCVRCTTNPDCPAGATCNAATDLCVEPPPVVVDPVNASTTTSQTPTLDGTATANASVTVSVDGAIVGTVTATAGGAWSLTSPTLSVGPHSVNAVSTVGAGGLAVVSGPSNTNTFTIKCTMNGNCVGNPSGATCNTVTGTCGNACGIDADCMDATKWCSAGSCTLKTANGNPLPAVGPINGQCTVANATRVCLSGVCDPSNKECGLTNGKTCGPPATSGKCDSTLCFAADNACGKPNGQGCVVPDICRSGICFAADSLCGLPNGQTCSANFVCRSVCVGADQACGLLNGSPCASAGDCRSSVCNSDGHCGDPNGTPCSSATTCRSAVCSGGQCGPRCLADADCHAGTYCDLPNGVCLPTLPNNQGCARPTMCSSAVCNADGKCGDPDGTTCAGAITCRSAVCKNLRCGGACALDAECPAGDYCNGGSCAPTLPNSQPCARPTMCSSGVCNLDGNCGNPTGQPCPSAAVCRSGICDLTNTCVATCATDRDCAAGTFCDATAMSCQPALVNGTACARNPQCASGVCDSDGKCGAPDGEPCGSPLLCRSASCPSTGTCGAVIVAGGDMAGGAADMAGAGDMSGSVADMSTHGGAADMSSTGAKRVTFSGGGFCELAPAHDTSSSALGLFIFGALMMLLVRRHGSL